jgi:hypothetical protein
MHGDMRNAHKMVWKPEETPRHQRENELKADMQEVGLEGTH